MSGRNCRICSAFMIKGSRTEVVVYWKIFGMRFPIRRVFLCSNQCTTQYELNWVGRVIDTSCAVGQMLSIKDKCFL